ncbi:MAG TPA: BBP7 family outer membrane beta-barrel protein [Pirellulales bacterium]
MLRARQKLLQLVIVVLATTAGSAFAQQDGEEHWNPFGPSNVRYDFDMFQPPDISAYADWPRPNEGLFFEYNRLYWAIQQPTRTEIGVAGGSELAYFGGPSQFDPTTQPISDILRRYGNSLDTGFLRGDQTWGNKFELGFMEDNNGWLVSIMNLQDQVQNYLASSTLVGATPAGIGMIFRDPHDLRWGFVSGPNSGGFDDDLNVKAFLEGTTGVFNGVPSVFGRPQPNNNLDTTGDGVPDAYAGFTDFGDQVPIPALFSSINVRNTTSFTGVEIDRTWRYQPTHIGGIWEMLIGLRWMLLRDEFGVTAVGAPNLTLLPGTSFWDATVDNNIFGPQIGFRYDHQVSRFDVMGEVRFVAGLNFQSTHLNGELGSGLDSSQNPQNLPLLLDPTSFHTWRFDETFAPVGEFRVGVGYQLTKAISVQAGYGGIVGGGISRASRRIDYVLPALQILNAHKTDAWFMDGLNLGITCNR